MSSPNNRRRFETSQAEDHISNLPDAILSHILSLVPTKSAVKTSILSKRWKYVWTKVPTLDFSELPLSKNPWELTSLQKSYFKSFVDKVLLHNDTSYVQRLCFHFSPHQDDDFYINSWLSALTRCEFHEIEFEGNAYRKEPVLLPTQLLSSERLVVLKLNGSFTVDPPVSLNLPNLEIIHLIYFHFPDDEFMKRLSSGSLFLKELLIHDCIGGKLNVESLTLKRLEIRYAEVGSIIIKAPSLRQLTLEVGDEEGLGPHNDFGDLGSLVEADLILWDRDLKQLFPLVKKVSGVKTLCLVTLRGSARYRSKLPIFKNLTYLQLEAEQNTCKLLKCAPSLQSLIFEKAC